ncbi:MAG: hypothetical protein HEQ19_01470 [Gloeotrichia echinulata CP02]|nr:hypothetical protein [Gloeotrichia echinulata DEX184]
MKIYGFGRNEDQAANAKRQLLKALYCRDIAAINTLIRRWQKIIGLQKLTDLICNQVLVECDSDSHSWFMQIFLGKSEYEQMQQLAQHNVFQTLVNQGLEPGRDFSIGYGGDIMINDLAKETLHRRLPEERQVFFQVQLESIPVSNQVTAIERMLGCPFFTNLTEIASQQIKLLSNSQAAAYLGVLLAGLVTRHPSLQDANFPTIFIFSSLQGLPQQRAIAILNDQEKNPEFDERIIFQHLLAALGDSKYESITDEDGGISLEQLKKLDLVWCGERPISQIIAMMEKWQLRNG